MISRNWRFNAGPSLIELTVRAEATDHYPDQLQRLEAAFAAGTLEEIRVTDLQEVQLFAQFTATLKFNPDKPLDGIPRNMHESSPVRPS